MGKGLDRESAQVSAMMEAIERVSAERVDRPIAMRPFSTMRDGVPCAIDPRAFDLPDDSSYAEDRPISWIDGWDLLRGEAVWVPLDAVITPPVDGILRDVDTNGLASGNTVLEAVVHGLCEVIERDALGILQFTSLFADADEALPDGRRIDPGSLPAEGREWVERLRASGLQIETTLLESDIGVAVCQSVILDGEYPSTVEADPRRFVGLGASPNAAVAAVRSIMEAVQSRLAIIQGARDSFNTLSGASRRSTAKRPLRDIEARSRVSLDDVPTFVSDDLLDDLEYLLGRLSDAGFERAIVIDLTRRDFGVPVVRVRVPGLTSFAVNRRRVGWRCLRYLL